MCNTFYRFSNGNLMFHLRFSFQKKKKNNANVRFLCLKPWHEIFECITLTIYIAVTHVPKTEQWWLSALGRSSASSEQ